MAAWADHAIWWQVYPLGFVGAERSALPPDAEPVHRLDRLEAWLDYLVGLGCNGLALGPVFASETHGYDTVDHLRVDPRLGDTHDLDALIAACQAKGVRVLLDGVFNHVGRGFGPFQDVLAHGRASAYANWFRLDWTDDGFDYADFEGHRQLVALNHDEPAVVEYVAEVMTHWLDRGIDGWRLDVAYAAPLPFWRQVTDRVHARHPDAWLFGEVIHGDYAGFVREGGLDSTTQYELWKAIWSSLNDRNLFELAWAFDRHAKLLEEFVPQTFVGNHDVTRIVSKLVDERHLGHALAVLFTLGGVPSVYAGDEQAFRGVKEDREGGDDEIRPAFPAAPDALASEGWPLYRLHQDLIGLRRRHAWLVRASVRVDKLANQQLAYTVSAADTEERLLVLLNLADDPFRFDVPAGMVKLKGSREAGEPAIVEAHGWSILG
ncbi:alpha-amylase family protein [Tenggerimyces flavus]|uniref:Alpha-amylase family protein n=1 Tax=Tenggerimyces flavus TaxID=1708749 RepID=A0ABV7Y5N8_9ACTN|nr:alpha-amylase family protein [Tenggerimyces flavus]MBM7788414.1 cyclomaltodextrinase [Tenggerimyces flavus]